MTTQEIQRLRLQLRLAYVSLVCHIAGVVIALSLVYGLWVTKGAFQCP